MNKPVLVVLAAGMGSRYGGLKQIDTVGDNGECIIDFSIYDAYRAGFRKVVLIIRKEHEEAFNKALCDKVRNKMEVEFAFQDMQDVPEWFKVPEGREKPWGTTHALLATRNIVKEPFMVINADDFYGKESYQIMYDALKDFKEGDAAMVGYKLANTLTENGSVTRGVCVVEDGYLKGIREVQEIVPCENTSAYKDGEEWKKLPEDTLCSMNYWGFTPAVFPLMEERFEKFLKGDKPVQNPMKAEHVIPTAVGELLEEDKINVKVLSTDFRWFGVTYKEDKPEVIRRIKEYKDAGIYPHDLWK